MIPVLQGQNFTTAAEFTKELNKARLQNRQKWITYTGMVAGKKVEIKTFDCGDLQILRVNGLRMNPRQYDLKVGEWKSEIEKCINA